MEYEYIACQQGTTEWFEARCGLPTASEMHTVMAVGARGGASIGRTKYLYKLAAETITGTPSEKWEGNGFTQMGHVLEPVARQLYEERTGYAVETAGFFRVPGVVGASPDGLIGTEGLLEIKSKVGHTHIQALLSGEVPPDYMKQIQTNLWVTGRAWCDFEIYSPGLPTFSCRVEPLRGVIEDIQDAVEVFNAEKSATVAKIVGLF